MCKNEENCKNNDFVLELFWLLAVTYVKSYELNLIGNFVMQLAIKFRAKLSDKTLMHFYYFT